MSRRRRAPAGDMRRPTARGCRLDRPALSNSWPSCPRPIRPPTSREEADMRTTTETRRIRSCRWLVVPGRSHRTGREHLAAGVQPIRAPGSSRGRSRCTGRVHRDAGGQHAAADRRRDGEGQRRHPTGFRFDHAKGIVVSGTFTPTAQARSLSPAAHFAGPAVPVTVRLSNGPGVPDNMDNDPGSGPRGMAIRFKLPGGEFTDIMAISNGFVVRTGEDFLAFFKAIAASGPDAPHPNPVEAFREPPPGRQVRNGSPDGAPELCHGDLLQQQRRGIRGQGRQETAGAISDRSGGRRGRLSTPRRRQRPAGTTWPPSSGNDWRAGRRSSASRQLANAGDPPTTARSRGRRSEAGAARHDPPDQGRAQPGRAAALARVQSDVSDRGIELSDDPLARIRSAVYALSVAHRH